MSAPPDLTPDLIVRAYASGVFPMARTRSSADVLWVNPLERGILPLDGLRVSRSLRKTLRRGVFAVSVDQDFDGVIRACAETRADWQGREETWINPAIEGVFRELFRLGLAHSVECRHNGVLVGGLYGLAIGGAFFGESMFSRVSDASKVALCHLVARLKHGGFRLLDTQFITDHLCRLGAIEIPRKAYLVALRQALVRSDAVFPPVLSDEEVLRLVAGSSFPAGETGL